MKYILVTLAKSVRNTMPTGFIQRKRTLQADAGQDMVIRGIPWCDITKPLIQDRRKEAICSRLLARRLAASGGK